MRLVKGQLQTSKDEKEAMKKVREFCITNKCDLQLNEYSGFRFSWQVSVSWERWLRFHADGVILYSHPTMSQGLWLEYILK